MTIAEAKALPVGIYLIFWTSGGMSKAVIQQNYNGEKILTCHNWTGGSGVQLSSYVYDIEKIVFIM